MTGLERNADVVQMASYAPLFAHAEGWQWTPDLIWVDNLSSYGSPGYYVQQMFSNNKGTNTVTILKNGAALSGADSLYASACIDKNKNELIIKLVNASGKLKEAPLQVAGRTAASANASLTVLQKDEPAAVNSFDQPLNVFPKKQTLVITGNQLTIPMQPYSFTVISIPLKP